MITDAVESRILKAPYKLAAKLIRDHGDDAESIVYRSPLSENVRESLLTNLRIRRVHIYNKKGY